MNDTSTELLIRDDISRPFTPERFNMRRRPLEIGQVPIESIGQLPSCLDMLIKLPGGEIVLPPPYDVDPGLAAFLAQAIAKEDDILPGWRARYHLYLTYDRRQVEAGRSHRNEGWHFDGMQGNRYSEKFEVCHQYVLSTHLPTEYTDHPTDATGLDENRHNWFLALGRQVPTDVEPIKATPGTITLMSAYQLHRSPVATPEEAGWRTFIRLDVSLKQQDRIGNSINPKLPAPWAFVERNLPDGLGVPVCDSSWSGAEKFSSGQAAPEVAHFATGRDLHRAFAHDGEPSTVALNPPQEPPHETPSYDEALGLKTKNSQ